MGRIGVTLAEQARYDIECVDSRYPGILDNLLDDFREYKQSVREAQEGLGPVRRPKYFGRDAKYHHPPDADLVNLRHIHLSTDHNGFKGKNQYYMTCPTGNPEKDILLVYASGFIEEDRFIILAILYPDGHAKGWNYGTMRSLIEAAESFQKAID